MIKNIKNILTLTLVALAGIAFGQIPSAEAGTFALTNATIETVTNGTIQNGTLIISDGKIGDVGTSVSIPDGAKTIDCSGLTIYPGMIDGGTQIGLVEVSSDPRTRDNNEIGDVIPHIQALTAVNPSSVIHPVTRVNGVTTALTMPSGGLFPGTAALINLHGYTPDQMYAGFKGVVVNFPATGRRGRWDRRSDEDIKKAAEKALKQLNEVWAKAVQYHKIDSATGGKDQPYYPEMEALLPAVRGEMKLLINVNSSKDIKSALEWIDEKGADAILCGVSEGWRVAEDIAKADVPVITGPVLSNPTRPYDRYDRPYANAGAMLQAGVKVAIRTNEVENTRNLPYHAGFAATYGMGKEEALKAVTIVPAEIFGVADKYGSIEKGKVANVFVTNGDPFETRTQVKYVFIDGWNIPMVSRHTQLYEEYLNRAPGVEK
ncbi:Imidazolonepropionase [Ekhidna lutea]|uniref:Imidazolonepropionase n=1 Tax=Ekhidna lutea TaxID=447679 RepID=A0A239LEQ7_EKHLU|nr:amidohydrolase family protein [Ekhidna lutea]SNT28422.1 Imidazolonepropionase [Ekhidna lutea]